MNIMKDKSSGVSRGFGFIEMTSPLESQAAIAGLKDQKLDGRTMDVTESSPPFRGNRRGGFSGGGEKRRSFQRSFRYRLLCREGQYVYKISMILLCNLSALSQSLRQAKNNPGIEGDLRQ